MISRAGKAALITGGSRRIGAAAVKLFAQAGADGALGQARNSKATAQVEQEIRRHDTRIEFCKADLSRMAGAKGLVEFARARLGRLDILVANTGICTARLIAQCSGRIIAISSTSGQHGEAFDARYSATKVAIISFVKGLATELARHNILVNASHPAG